MTFTASLLLDLTALLILVYFFMLGLRRGFILTLFSLLSFFLALGGGWYLSHTYTPALEETLTPILMERLLLRETESQDSAPPTSVEDPLSQSLQSIQNAATQELAKSIAHKAAAAILFVGGFLAVSLLWSVLCHALHLVAKLPGLHFVNKTLGAVLGLVKGILLLLLLRWVLCDLLGWIPLSAAEGSYILSFLSAIPSLFGDTDSILRSVPLP